RAHRTRLDAQRQVGVPHLGTNVAAVPLAPASRRRPTETLPQFGALDHQRAPALTRLRHRRAQRFPRYLADGQTKPEFREPACNVRRESKRGAALRSSVYHGNELPLACQKPPLFARFKASIRASNPAAATSGSTCP